MEQVRLKRLRDQVAAKRAAAQRAPAQEEQTIVPQQREPQGALDTARGAIESINQGTTLGFGDEIVGGIRAGIDRLLPNYEYDFGEGVEDSEQGLRDAYRMYRDDSGDVQEQFASENPVTAAVLEIGGAIASPANLVRAPAAIARLAQARPLSGALGRAATEGAIYGAGAADEGEILEGALSGAAMGAGGTLALKGIGAAGGNFVKDRFSEALGKGDDFLPLNFQEGGLGDFYRDYIGRAYGGSRKLRDQSAPIVGRARRVLDRTEEKVGGLKQSLAREKEAVTGAAKRMKDEAGQQASLAADEAADAARAIKPTRVVENTDALNLDALKKSVPPAYADGVTEIGEAGVRQTTKAINDAYDAAWGDVRLPRSWRKQISAGLDEFKGELDDVGQAKVARVQRELVKEPPLKAQQIDQVINELIPSVGGGTQNALKGLRQTLRSRLSANRQKALQDVDAVYPNYLATTGASSKADATGGVFTGKQLATEARRVGGRKRTALGEAPLGQEARSAVQSQEAAKRAATSEKERLAENALQLRRTAAKQKKDAARKANVLVKTQGRKARQKSADAEQALDKAKDNYQTIKRLAPPDPESISGLSSALTTKSIVPQIGFQGLNLATGSALARGLASPSVQRTLAGQTGTQKYVADLLRRTARERELARMGITRYMAGQAGD